MSEPIEDECTADCEALKCLSLALENAGILAGTGVCSKDNTAVDFWFTRLTEDKTRRKGGQCDDGPLVINAELAVNLFIDDCKKDSCAASLLAQRIRTVICNPDNWKECCLHSVRWIQAEPSPIDSKEGTQQRVDLYQAIFLDSDNK